MHLRHKQRNKMEDSKSIPPKDVNSRSTSFFKRKCNTVIRKKKKKMKIKGPQNSINSKFSKN